MSEFHEGPPIPAEVQVPGFSRPEEMLQRIAELEAENKRLTRERDDWKEHCQGLGEIISQLEEDLRWRSVEVDGQPDEERHIVVFTRCGARFTPPEGPLSNDLLYLYIYPEPPSRPCPSCDQGGVQEDGLTTWTEDGVVCECNRDDEPGNGLESVLGKWPGDETEEQLLQKLRELDGKRPDEPESLRPRTERELSEAPLLTDEEIVDSLKAGERDLRKLREKRGRRVPRHRACSAEGCPECEWTGRWPQPEETTT